MAWSTNLSMRLALYPLDQVDPDIPEDPEDPGDPGGGGDPPPAGFGVVVPSGVSGAGYQNSSAISPDGKIWATGGDVAGVSISWDKGNSWAPARRGLTSSDHLRTCGMTFNEASNELWIFTTGWRGAPRNYIFKATVNSAAKTISGFTQVHQVTGGWASAQNEAQPYKEGGGVDDKASFKSGHPRQTGRMIALDEAAGKVYVGSADGIWVANMNGSGTPQRLWGEHLSITGLVLDPNDPNWLYCTGDFRPWRDGPAVGVHKVPRFGKSGAVQSVTGGHFDYPQSIDAESYGGQTYLVVSTGKLMGSQNKAGGVMAHPPGNFTTGWLDITNDMLKDETKPNNVRTSGVTIRRIGASFTIVASNAFDDNGGTGARLWWTTWDGSSSTVSWDRPTSANTTYTLPTGERWWLSELLGSLMADKPGYDSPNPLIAPDGTIYSAGRSSMWRVNPARTKVQPICVGVMAVTSWGVYAHPTVGGKVIYEEVDWSIHRFNKGAIKRPIGGRPSSKTGWAGYFSKQGAFAFGGGKSGMDGGVWVSDDPCKDGPAVWRDEVATGSGRGWGAKLGIVKALWLDGVGTNQVLIMVCESGHGMWRKVGAGANGTWTKIQASDFKGVFGNQLRGQFTQMANGSLYYADPKDGLWRSTNRGASWTQASTLTNGSIYSGHIASHPTQNIAYWSHGGNLHKIVDGSPPTLTPVGGSLGTVAGVSFNPVNGDLWVAETGNPKVWRSQNATGSPTFQDMTTDSWRNTCGTVKHIVVDLEQNLHVSTYSGFAVMSVAP